MSLTPLTTLPPVRQVGHAASPAPVAVASGVAVGGSPAAASTGNGAPTVTELSPASQLMSRLGQLAQQDPAKFKSVARSIASHLASDGTAERRELAKRSALQAELAQVDQRISSEQSSTSGSKASAPSGSPREALLGTFTAAASTGTLGAGAATAAVSWSDSDLAGALAAALSAVNEALGGSG